MAEARTYLTDELEQKEAKKISSFLFRSVIDSKEEIIAIFGYAGMTGCACLISTRDLLLYFSNASMRPQQTAILYSDLADVAVKFEGKNPVLSLTDHDGKEITVSIKASAEETNKMLAFIQGYQTEGAAYVTQQMGSGADYTWKIDAIHSGKSLKKAELDRNVIIRRQATAQKIKELEAKAEQYRLENTPEARAERVREIKEAGQRKIAAKQAATAQEIKEHKAKAEQYRLENTPEGKAKRIKDFNESEMQKIEQIHEKTSETLDRITRERNLATYQLNYCSGFDASVPAGTIKVHVDGFKQHFELTFANGVKMLLPFAWIRGSEIVPEKEVPPDDYTNEYVYYLKISCEISGQPCELILSHTHKQGLPMDPVRLLHVTIQELPNKIGAFNQRNAYYDQRAQELAAERERLLAQRAGQVAEIRNLFSGGSQTVQPATSQPTVAPTADPVEAIKKYKELLDQGILTQEEFDTKKKQLLGL